MPAGEGPAIARYGAALLFVATAFLLQLFGPMWLHSLPFMPFFAVVLAASWLGGLGPGLLACALSVPAALYAAIEPVGSIRPTDPRAWIGVIGFLIIAGLLTVHTNVLRKAVRDARAAIALRDDFLSIASHELNTPIAAMRLDVRTLLRSAEKQDLARVVAVSKRVDNSASRLVTLVDHLLDSTRVRSGRLELSREPFDLGELAAEVIDRFGESTIELRRQPATGKWDRGRLDQVITNLLTNAIKYSDNKPIVVTVSMQGNAAELAVCDRGVGVPEAARGRIFDRFERIASSRNYGGFGLGLWISNEIVVAHGGSIGVRETEGGGSTFVVKLPANT
jgi:signal transduction histidine kinase